MSKNDNNGERADKSRPTSAGGTILWLLGIAVLAAIGLFLWDEERVKKFLGIGSEGGALAPAPPAPRAKGDEELLRRLVETGASSAPSAAEELTSTLGADWRRTDADRLLRQLEDQAGIRPLSLLPRGGQDAGVLKDELGLDRKRVATDSLAIRQYLHEWRSQLRQLRWAGKQSLADADPEKLRDFPTLALLKELTADRYRALDREAGKAPQSPWLMTEDQETAELISYLFLRSEAGKVFLDHPERAGGVGRAPTLPKIFAALHGRKAWQTVTNSLAREIADSEQVVGQPRLLDQHAMPAVRLLRDFLKEERWGDLVKKLSNSGSLRSLLLPAEMSTVVSISADGPAVETPRVPVWPGGTSIRRF